MKHIFTHLLLFFLLLPGFEVFAQTTHVVRDSSFLFTPAAITISQGDTVNFILGSFHNVVEVTQATWNANDTTSNGGFSLGLGGGKVKLNNLQTYYYVCGPHASFGMKGTITVVKTTAIDPDFASSFSLAIQPQPIGLACVASVTSPVAADMQLELSDLSGNRLLVQQARIVAGENSVEIDMAHLPSGIYLLSCNVNGERLYPARVVKAN